MRAAGVGRCAHSARGGRTRAQLVAAVRGAGQARGGAYGDGPTASAIVGVPKGVILLHENGPKSKMAMKMAEILPTPADRSWRRERRQR